MDAFVWDERFAIGEAQVDFEHQGLVRIINAVVALHRAGGGSAAELGPLLNELFDYAATHFRHEEALMQGSGIDARHCRQHALAHGDFTRQVRRLRELPFQPTNTSHLARFLTGWLAAHILREDRSMMRQIERVRAGIDAADAYAAELAIPVDVAVDNLLQAMDALYRLADARSEQLQLMKDRLEELVAERTQQLLQSEKMAAVGQLAAGVAHEINNPIGFVRSNLSTLKRYLDQFGAALDAAAGGTTASDELAFVRADAAALVEESEEGVERVRRIVADLREFSQVDAVATPRAVDVHAGIDSMLNILRARFGNRCEVVREYGRVPEVVCQPALLNQVLLNLCVNAVEAMDARGGQLTVRTGPCGDGVCIEVADDGRGIAPEHLPHIFEPFFTTKPVGSGTGLGLAVAYGIVQQHQGTLTATSTPGVGSCFHIELPARPPR
ncbi:MAG: hemerythrin domain-containing protein [Xanthomonadales bacterium]|nr:hemerythrin domain-containing protein [Xanthomonadales bacterium]